MLTYIVVALWEIFGKYEGKLFYDFPEIPHIFLQNHAFIHHLLLDCTKCHCDVKLFTYLNRKPLRDTTYQKEKC